MIRKLHLALVGAVLVAACDGGGGGGDGDGDVSGIASLGRDFVLAFQQNRNDEPVDAQSVELRLTPREQPFNP